MAIRLTPLFPTPIYVVAVPDAAVLNEAFLSVVRGRRETDRGVSKSNLGGWQSDIEMLAWAGAPAKRLVDLVLTTCTRITSSTTGAPVDWKPEMWANINRSGDSNQNHWHPGSYLSFVYYVDDGYAGSSDRNLGGELVFLDPRMPFLRMRTPYLRHRQANGAVEEHETWIRPYSGLLIGFPAFLQHSVRPYRGGRERVSVAVNVAARVSA